MQTTRRQPLFLRAAAGFLALALSVPSPALALRTEADAESGLEEKLRLALSDQRDPVAATATVLGGEVARALGIPPAKPFSLNPAAGLEELAEQIHREIQMVVRGSYEITAPFEEFKGTDASLNSSDQREFQQLLSAGIPKSSSSRVDSTITELLTWMEQSLGFENLLNLWIQEETHERFLIAMMELIPLRKTTPRLLEQIDNLIFQGLLSVEFLRAVLETDPSTFYQLVRLLGLSGDSRAKDLRVIEGSLGMAPKRYQRQLLRSYDKFQAGLLAQLPSAEDESRELQESLSQTLVVTVGRVAAALQAEPNARNSFWLARIHPDTWRGNPQVYEMIRWMAEHPRFPLRDQIRLNDLFSRFAESGELSPPGSFDGVYGFFGVPEVIATLDELLKPEAREAVERALFAPDDQGVSQSEKVGERSSFDKGFLRNPYGDLLFYRSLPEDYRQRFGSYWEYLKTLRKARSAFYNANRDEVVPPATGLEESFLESKIRELRQRLIAAVQDGDWAQVGNLLDEVPTVPEIERTGSIETHLKNIQALRAVFLTQPHLLDPTPSETKNRHFSEALDLIPPLLEEGSLVDPGVREFLRTALIYIVGGLGEAGMMTEPQARLILLNPKIELPERSVWTTLFGFSLLELQQAVDGHPDSAGGAPVTLTTSDSRFRPLIAKALAMFPLAVAADTKQEVVDLNWEQDRITRFASFLILSSAEIVQKDPSVPPDERLVGLLAVARALGPVRSELKLEMRKEIPNQATVLNLAAVGARMLEPMAEWLGLEKAVQNFHEAGNTYAAELIQKYPDHSFWNPHLFPEVRSTAGLEEVRAVSRELVADLGISDLLSRNGWAPLTPRLRAAGYGRKAIVVSDSASVEGRHVIIAPANLRNPRAKALFPWVEVQSRDPAEIVKAAKGAGARRGDLILLDAASGLEEGQIQRLLTVNGLQGVRVVVGTPAQVKRLPPAAFNLFAGLESSLPPVIFLDVATGLEEEADETHTLLLMK